MYIYVLGRRGLTTYTTVTMILYSFIPYMRDIDVSNMHNAVGLVWTRLWIMKQEIKKNAKSYTATFKGDMNTAK